MYKLDASHTFRALGVPARDLHLQFHRVGNQSVCFMRSEMGAVASGDHCCAVSSSIEAVAAASAHRLLCPSCVDDQLALSWADTATGDLAYSRWLWSACNQACFGQWDSLVASLTRGNVNNPHPDLGTTPLHWASGACASISLPTVLQSLSLGGDPNARDAEDWTPLCYAAYRGSADVMRALIDGGGDVGALTERGQSPLVILVQAVGSGVDGVDVDDAVAQARLLLAAPATDLGLRYEGKTAREWAEEGHAGPLADLLAAEETARAL